MSNQSADVTNTFISERGRLISDILEVRNTLNIDGFFVTVYNEKAFDSVNHSFSISMLKIFGFINELTNTSYFTLERGARKGDSMSAYLFTLVLEIIFIMIKSDQNI